MKDAVAKFADRERKEALKASKFEKRQCSIAPDSYVAKEIKYQTALLHQIKDEIKLLKLSLKEKSPS